MHPHIAYYLAKSRIEEVRRRAASPEASAHRTLAAAARRRRPWSTR